MKTLRLIFLLSSLPWLMAASYPIPLPGNSGNVMLSNGTKWTSGTVTATVQTQSYGIMNLGLATSVGSSALTIALKQADGSTNPAAGSGAVKVSMRSSTLTSGLYNERSATGALSLVISSGSTLGQTSAVPSTLWIYLIDNAGTLELGASTALFQENQMVTTTAEGGAGAADSAVLMYSTTARSAVPFRLIGSLINTQSTAGTWASAGTILQVGMMGTIGKFQPTMTAWTATGSYVTAADSSVDTVYEYEVVGGGGGGGGANGAGASAGGGGAAATCRGTFKGVAASITITTTVGTGGAGGVSDSSNGATGVASVISGTGMTTVTAGAGAGATTSTSGPTGGAAGGACTNGTVGVTGGSGGHGVSAATSSGHGGGSTHGSGGIAAAAFVSGTGGNGIAYGSGGGGALGATATGGTGKSGLIIIKRLTL